MAVQLALIDPDDLPGAPHVVAYDHSRFELDARTRAVGLEGLARARAVLEAARRANAHHGSESAA